MRSKAELTVLIATNRPQAVFLKTAVAIARGCPPEIPVEILIVHNGVRGVEYTKPLGPSVSLVYLVEPVAGKSHALNRGLLEATSDVILFTDDDVMPGPQWAERYYNAFRLHGGDDCFCGPIFPSYPPETPEWIVRHRYASILFAQFIPQQVEGGLAAGTLPFGPNFAVRKSALGNLKFRLNLGPSAVNGALLGEDIDFTAAVKDRLSITTESRGFRYLPNCAVAHLVAPNRLQFGWMMERFFHLGRSRAIRFDRSSHITSRPALLHPSHNAMTEDRAVTEAGELNFYYGQYHECLNRGAAERAEYFLGVLEKMDYLALPKYYSASMKAAVAARPLPGRESQASA